jgi:hypothetical protein
MVDKDTIEHINKYNKEHATPIAKEVARMMGRSTEELAGLIDKAYETHEEFGESIFSSIITAILVSTSKNLDQSIERLDKVYKNTRQDMIRLDKEVNMK